MQTSQYFENVMKTYSSSIQTNNLNNLLVFVTKALRLWPFWGDYVAKAIKKSVNNS